MAAIGYDLYVKMIEETVRELRGDASQAISKRMEIRVDAVPWHGYFDLYLRRTPRRKNSCKALWA